MAPVARALAKQLKQSVTFVPAVTGLTVTAAVAASKPGDVLMLENLRFVPGEDAASLPFARQLARLGDLFVFDAFGVAHRTTATTTTLKRLLPSFAGLLVQSEVAALSGVLDRPKRPLTAIIGGAKISTKIQLVQRLLPHVDYLCLGGALANTLLSAQGVQVGRSIVEPEFVKELKRLRLTDTKLKLPVDVVVSQSLVKPVGLRRTAVANVRPNERIVDVGPDTVALFGRVARASRTVVWNGPIGIYEVPGFARSTRALARVLADLSATTVVGGGETLDAIRSQGLSRSFTHLCTGGGAMLAFLEGKQLPGLSGAVAVHSPHREPTT
jgi:phosphoglycerate kinase